MNYQEELKRLKKANKITRERIAAKRGFEDAQKYMELLAKGGVILPKKEKGKAKKKIVHNIHILDASGSMHGLKFSNAIEGINNEIEQLKKETLVDYTQTFIDFSYSNDILVRNWKEKISDIQRVSNKGTRGSTALFQAMGETLERLEREAKPDEKVLVKVFTDGGENDSKGVWKNEGTGWNPRNARLRDLIKRLEGKGFTITFVGTLQDVDNIVKNLNIDESNTLVHDNTAEGVKRSFKMSMAATQMYAENLSSGKDVTRGFYKKVGKL